MNRDGSKLRRLTNHPAIDVDADLVADRHADRLHLGARRRAAIYVVGVDGLGLAAHQLRGYSDRPTWSPAPFNEIAYRRAHGPGYDIKVLNIADGATRQITFGEGSNESPAWAPNGRHLAFTSTRAGRDAGLHRGSRRQERPSDHA